MNEGEFIGGGDAVEDEVEDEHVRQPDFSRGEKAMYTLDEMIGMAEDLRVANDRIQRLKMQLSDGINALSKIAYDMPVEEHNPDGNNQAARLMRVVAQDALKKINDALSNSH